MIYTPYVIIYHDYAENEEKLKTKLDRHVRMNDYLRWKYADIEQFRIPNNNILLVRPENKLNERKEENTLITICIPTFNRAEYLGNAITSALKQNCNNYEIVIVDDGSTDNTKSVVESLKSEKIKYVRKENTGAPDTRNQCIDVARGDFILWLDDDDLLVENSLGEYIKLLNNYPDSDIIYGELKSFRRE